MARRSKRSFIRGTQIVAMAAGIGLIIAGCASTGGNANSSSAGLTQVSIALDWTPNTNHTGIYVADALGYFKQQGIDLKIIPYGSTAPETLISSGAADFGFSYEAGVAYAHASGEDVTSVFTPYQKGLYAIAVRADRNDIATPKDLDGKTYAGFGDPDEKPELQYVIKQAGGTGNFTEVTLNTSAYQAVYGGQADFTIASVAWEVIQAKLANKPLKTFDPTAYGFPDYYETLIASSQKYLTSHPDLARKFLAAVTEGYAYAADHPQDAAKILTDANPSVLTNPQLVDESQAFLASDGYPRNAQGQVGNQSATEWQGYGDFLYNNGLLVDGKGNKLTTQPNWNDYYTNAYLPASSQ